MKFLTVAILSCISLATTNFCNAQVFQDIVPGNTGAYGSFHTNDLLVMGQGEYVDIDNADIDGSPFWNNDWKAAFLYTGNYALFVSRVKLNLFKNTVYYMNNNGQVMIAKTGQVKKIEFFNGDDTSNVIADFAYINYEGDKKAHFYQVLNRGKTELIKLDTVIIKKTLFDPISGKENLYYLTKTVYYLYYNAKMIVLKSLNKDAIFQILKPLPEINEWLNKNKNKLKSESDCIGFLNYFNTLADK